MFDQRKTFKRTGALALLMALALLCSSLPARAADETAQVMMLKQLFGSDQSDWKEILARHSGLLDQTFFERCEARIRWGIENNHFEDSIRFAIVADLAAMAVKRPDMYRFDLAVMFVKAGNPENALDLLENILISNPNHMQALFMKASIFHDSQRYAEAYDYYQEVLRGGYNLAECYYRMALIDFLLGRDNEGKKNLANGLAKEPQHQGLLALDAKVKQLENNMRIAPGETIQTMPTSQLSPEDQQKAAGLFQEAEKQAAAGNESTAEACYIDVLKIDRRHKEARKYLGALYYRQAKLEKAAEQFSQVAQLDKGDVENFHFLGMTYERLFDTKGGANYLTAAIDAYQKAAELDPANPMVQSELARAQAKVSSSAAGQP